MYTVEIIGLVIGLTYFCGLIIITISDMIKLRKDKKYEDSCDCCHCIMDCCPHSSAHSEEYKRAIAEKEKT